MVKRSLAYRMYRLKDMSLISPFLISPIMIIRFAQFVINLQITTPTITHNGHIKLLNRLT